MNQMSLIQNIKRAPGLSGYCLILVLICFVLSRPVSADILTPAERNWLNENREIAFVSQSAYPPFEFIDKGGARRGMCLDLVRWIAAELGFEVRFLDMAFKEAQEEVLSGSADVMTSMFFSELRDELFDFTDISWEVPALVFVPGNCRDIADLKDLRGRRVAIQRGDYAEEYLDSRNIEYEAIPCASLAAAVNLVLDGEADALIGDEEIVLFHLYCNSLQDEMKAVGEPLYEGQNCMAVREGNDTLRGILNKGIRLARNQGAHDRITKMWLGTSHDHLQPWLIRYATYLVIGLGIILVIIILVFIWNAQLRRLANLQTRELSFSKDRLAQALEGGGLGTWDWDIKTGWTTHNDRWHEILGYAPPETDPHIRSWSDRVHPDDWPGVERALEAHFSGENSFYETEHRLRHKSGKWVWVMDRGVVIDRDDDGSPLRACGVVQDISPRKTAELEYEKREQYMLGMNEIASILLTSTGEIPYQDFLQKLGETAKASRVYVFFNHEGVDGQLLMNQSAEWCAEGISPEIDNPQLQNLSYADNFPRWEDILSRGGIISGRVAEFPKSIRDILEPWNIKTILIIPILVDKEFIGFVGFDNCVSDREWDKMSKILLHTAVSTLAQAIKRKRGEEDKFSLERQVQHAQKLESLGILAGGIAHDFNNILVAILGNADLALADLPEDGRPYHRIKEIEKASQRAAELTGQMLAYSGKGEFVIGPIHMGELVKEMVYMLEVSMSKKIIMEYQLAENLPTFEGDVSQIRQVILNLVVNASEAIGDTEGVISVKTGFGRYANDELKVGNLATPSSGQEKLPAGEYVFLEVIDTGCGMDVPTQKKIFDPFFTTKFTGRGLGLAAVLGVIRGHRGVLKVDSALGRGASFKVMFPAKDTSQERKVPSPVSAEDTEEKNTWKIDHTVLIIDDEEAVRLVSKKMLERRDFKVLLAADGIEGVKIFQENIDAIDIVLLDLTMPGLNGEQVFLRMRELKADIKVVLSSGYNEQDAMKHFAGKGLAGFVQKPYKSAELIEKLRQALDGEA